MSYFRRWPSRTFDLPLPAAAPVADVARQRAFLPGPVLQITRRTMTLRPLKSRKTFTVLLPNSLLSYVCRRI